MVRAMTQKTLIITLGGQKGGTGKSTLSVHMAAELHARGRRVLVIDADPQGTALTWSGVASDREVKAPSVTALGDNLRQVGRELAAQYDVTLIDTAGRHDRRLASALMITDMVLLPCRPFPIDIWALGESVETVKKAQELRPELKAWIVLNGGSKDRRVAVCRDARKAAQKAGVDVLRTELGQRVAFAEAMALGMGVTAHAPSSQAAHEMRQLVTEIERHAGMGGSKRKAVA